MRKKNIIEPEIMLKYFQGETNEEDNSDLLKWINQSELNKKLFLEFKYLWETSKLNILSLKAETDKEWKEFADKILVKETKVAKTKIVKFRTIVISALKIAAVFILVFGLSWFILNQNKGQQEGNSSSFYEFTTPKGAKSKVILPDGSKIWLNSESMVKFPEEFSGNNRNIYLEGEAYFDVQKNEKNPLIIRTSDINIKVVGTTFNVKSYPGEGTIETTLERGIIIIQKEASGSFEKNTEITLKPNQRVTFVKKQGRILLDDIKPVNIIEPATNKQVRKEKIIVNENIKPEKYTAWKDGKLIFDNESFENLAIKLERWYNIKIHIEDENLKKIRFTGTFEKETIEQVLNIMNMTTPIIYKMDKNEIFIKMNT